MVGKQRRKHRAEREGSANGDGMSGAREDEDGDEGLMGHHMRLGTAGGILGLSSLWERRDRSAIH